MQADRKINEPIRVAVVDDHHLFRDGVIATLNETDDFKVIAAGERGSEAVRIASDSVPEIMLLDLNMPDGGIHAAREIFALCPYVKIIILTSCDGSEHFAEISDAGVRIFLMKGVSAASLLETLRNVHRTGEPMLDEVCESCGRHAVRLLHHEEKACRAGSGEPRSGSEECPLRREFASRKRASTDVGDDSVV